MLSLYNFQHITVALYNISPVARGRSSGSADPLAGSTIFHGNLTSNNQSTGSFPSLLPLFFRDMTLRHLPLHRLLGKYIIQPRDRFSTPTCLLPALAMSVCLGYSSLVSGILYSLGERAWLARLPLASSQSRVSKFPSLENMTV